jgi:hypothetical protein
MESNKKPNVKSSPANDTKNLPWRKKFVAQILSDVELENKLSEHNLERDDIEPKLDESALDHDHLENQVKEYLDDEKESDIRVLEYYKENISDERAWDWLKYRWEFMRRNPDYINAFKQEQQTKEKEEPSFNLFKRFEFWKNFGLLCSELPDPKLSFEQLQDSQKANSLGEPFFRINFITKNFGLHEGISYFTYLDEKLNFNKFNKLQIHVDFAKIKSIDVLKSMVGKLIEDHWKGYQKGVRLKKKSDTMDDYELILKVGDLKEKEGLSNKKIVERVFQGAENQKSAQRKASLYYKKYKELINGGYKNFNLTF